MIAALELLARVIEVLFPPRNTEAIVRSTPLSAYEGLVRPRTIEGCEALLPYSDPRVRALIWELKYKDSKIAATIAGKLLAEYVVGILAEEMIHQAILVPVPLHPHRQRERGYNQCERTAQEMLPALHGAITLAADALTRIRDTPRQTALGRGARLRNVAGAFAADPEIVRDKNCILIDDVITTGSTLTEAKDMLLHAGAAKVIAVALAYA